MGRCLSAASRVHLHPPSRTSAGIRVVRGTVPLTLLVQDKPVVLTDQLPSAKGKRVKVGNVSFLFEEVVRRPEGVAEVQLTVTDEKPGVNDDGWCQAMAQRFEIQDDKGRACPIPSWGASGNGMSPNQVHLRFEMRPGGIKLGPPSKLIFHDWVTREHLASFEFKELPLP